MAEVAAAAAAAAAGVVFGAVAFFEGVEVAATAPPDTANGLVVAATVTPKEAGVV